MIKEECFLWRERGGGRECLDIEEVVDGIAERVAAAVADGIAAELLSPAFWMEAEEKATFSGGGVASGLTGEGAGEEEEEESMIYLYRTDSQLG